MKYKAIIVVSRHVELPSSRILGDRINTRMHAFFDSIGGPFRIITVQQFLSSNSIFDIAFISIFYREGYAS